MSSLLASRRWCFEVFWDDVVLAGSSVSRPDWHLQAMQSSQLCFLPLKESETAHTCFFLLHCLWCFSGCCRSVPNGSLTANLPLLLIFAPDEDVHSTKQAAQQLSHVPEDEGYTKAQLVATPIHPGLLLILIFFLADEKLQC